MLFKDCNPFQVLRTSMKKILVLLIITFVNIALTIILISVLADGLLEYKMGFYVLAPYILGFSTFILYFLYNQTMRFKKYLISSLNYSWTIGFIFINLIILFFNYICWLDLFDGTTKAMLP